MKDSKKAAHDRAMSRLEADQLLGKYLGLVVLTGMEVIADMDRIVGGDLEYTYHTEFLMNDGARWELTLCQVEPDDAR